MAVLRIASLSKEFATGATRIRAVDDLEIEVADGELLVVLGPSGCGKTTLLRLIAGVETPTSGEIFVGSDRITRRTPQDRGVSMAFQYPALLPQLTVADNISLGPKLRGVSTADRSARTQELAALLDITDLLSRVPETLSGGQQQRVSLARALATRPQVMLLDEPLANLDPAGRSQLRDLIRNLQQSLRVTTVYVTHDQQEAASLGDRIAIMNNGRIEGLGTAEKLYNDPPNLFVAQFFGPETPNQIYGKFETQGFRPNGTNWAFRSSVHHSGEATCVLRPRAIRVGSEFSAEVTSLQHSGWSTTLRLSVQNLQLRAELPPNPALRPGTPFSFTVDPTDLLFFDSFGARIR